MADPKSKVIEIGKLTVKEIMGLLGVDVVRATELYNLERGKSYPDLVSAPKRRRTK